MLLDLNIFLTSVGRYSRMRERFFGSYPSITISLRLMIFGCLSLRSNSISLRIRRDSCLFSKKFLIFLMATLSPLLMLMAENTLEETPFPIY